jgi:molecular chaperone GrpE
MSVDKERNTDHSGNDQEQRPPVVAGAAAVEDSAIVSDDYSAAAPPDTYATGEGETSFSDADVAPAGTKPGSDPIAHPEQTQSGSDPEVTVTGASESKADEYLALARRTQADFENYRKRIARDAAQATEREVARIAKDLLPAIDHFTIALRSAAEHEGEDAEIVKGFRLVHDELMSALAKHGIEAFSPLGEKFDPNLHEAMAQQQVEGAQSGTIVEVYQQGYRLNGTLLRPARVIVAA